MTVPRTRAGAAAPVDPARFAQARGLDRLIQQATAFRTELEDAVETYRANGTPALALICSRHVRRMTSFITELDEARRALSKRTDNA